MILCLATPTGSVDWQSFDTIQDTVTPRRTHRLLREAKARILPKHAIADRKDTHDFHASWSACHANPQSATTKQPDRQAIRRYSASTLTG
ncbi:hypothetical protein D805_1550 [Bifidobacterium thermophilum RBL67]|uniref:Uncharacterized protein n=1 Tax=Bifidobacterium thermophilum RBL67 TaxID=1254439 RepID=M4RTI5_9BIFI|nr:hypothetical protein D805_1550 [Bifidobacterium thermophilum RBL67]